jgi:molecular chaperone HscC
MIIGIDLGTTNSLVSVWQNGSSKLIPNALGAFLTPSAVGLDDDGTVLIGQAAKERLQTHPQLTAEAFKRSMGTAHEYKLGKRSFRAEDLSSFVLRSLKSDAEAFLEQPVSEAVVTVPAYFSDHQRQATRSAGLLAGFESITLLNEPTAAALAYGLHQKNAETKFLVFDLGGGTFDVSILEIFEGIMEVKATAGDNQLGGNDIDRALENLFVQKTALPEKLRHNPQNQARLAALIEVAKKRLATEDVTEISLSIEGKTYAYQLSITELEGVVDAFAERLKLPIERAMRDARIPVAELDAVVLAGGSTRLRSVRRLVTKLFGRLPNMLINPDEVVAMGAAVQAALKMNDAALSERVMTDVCPYTLGIETSMMVGGKYATGFMSPVLERNTVIPASRVERYNPIVDQQTQLNIHVYQGEARRVADNIKLGEIEVPLQAGKTNEVAADVRFTYDSSGLLEVEVTPLKNGQATGPVRQLVIQNNQNRLSPEEIAARLASLSDLKIHPRERLEARALIARADRVHSQVLGDERAQLAHAIANFETALDSQQNAPIASTRATLVRLLDLFDGHQIFTNADE